MRTRTLIAMALVAALGLPGGIAALGKPDAKRCADIEAQRATIADEVTRLKRQIAETTVEAFAAALKRRVAELEQSEGELRAESAGCDSSGSTTSAPPPPGPPPGMPPSPPIPDPNAPSKVPAPTPSRSAPPGEGPMPAVTVRKSVSSDLCTLLPAGFVIGQGNEPGNATKKPRPGVPRYCEGAGSAEGPHYIAISVEAFGDASSASAEVEGYRKLPGGGEATPTSEVGEVALTSTAKTDHPSGGAYEEHMVAFARGRYFVYVQASGPKISEARQITAALDATLKQWASGQ